MCFKPYVSNTHRLMTVDVFRLLEFGVGRVPVLVDFEQGGELFQTEQHVRTRLSEAGRDIEIVAKVVSVELVVRETEHGGQLAEQRAEAQFLATDGAAGPVHPHVKMLPAHL